MSFDGIVTRAVVKELNDKLVGGKVNRINQPENRTILLQIYKNKNNYKLLLDASSNRPGFYLSNENKENPIKAPNFCMLLRKHLQNGVIESIEQKGIDRVVDINISSMNELGDLVTKTLTIEVMGKYSNIILREGFNILDSITRVTEDLSRVRQLLPGLSYTYIEDSKVDITRENKLPSEIISNMEKDIKMARFFYMNYTGFSPQISDEILYESIVDRNKKSKELNSEELEKIDTSFKNIVDKILSDDYLYATYRDETGNMLDFHCLKLNYLMAEIKTEENMSTACEKYFTESFVSDKVSQKASSLSKKVYHLLEKDRNKLVKLLDEREKAKDREKYKIYADIISANVHNMDRGLKSIVLQNFYDPELSNLDIPLDVKKSPWENAQFYYKKFSKLKTSENLLKKQIPLLEDDIKYFEQVLDSLKKVETDSEVMEIRSELANGGYISKGKTKNKNKSSKPSTPHHFVNERDKHFYVGKNNYQNDYITLKLANRDDIFIHVKDVPGSHVILRNDNITKEDILDGCFLAAKYSSVSNEQNVAVDYTEKKNVRKAKGAKPGMVYYDDFNTNFVNPKEFNFQIFKEI